MSDLKHHVNHPPLIGGICRIVLSYLSTGAYQGIDRIKNGNRSSLLISCILAITSNSFFNVCCSLLIWIIQYSGTYNKYDKFKRSI